MGKQIYFTDLELQELRWIIPQFRHTHEDSWGMKEAKLVYNIIKKIDTREESHS